MNGTTLLFAAFGLVLGSAIAVTVLQVGKSHSNKRHCTETLEGVAVRDATSGRVVCLKKEVVLKSYT